jgi:hypothetical protein
VAFWIPKETLRLRVAQADQDTDFIGRLQCVQHPLLDDSNRFAAFTARAHGARERDREETGGSELR